MHTQKLPRQNLTRALLLICCSILFQQQYVHAQEEVPWGDRILNISFPHYHYGYLGKAALEGSWKLYLSDELQSYVEFPETTESVPAADPPSWIDVYLERGPNLKFDFLNAEGGVYEGEIDSSGNDFLYFEATPADVPPLNSSGVGFSKIEGDKIYVLENSTVMSSSDGGATWQTDTVGGLYNACNDFALDTSQNIYAANAQGIHSGLYYQSSSASTWTKINSFPGPNPRNVFVDRQNRIWTSNNFGETYYSTDNATSWQLSPTAAFSPTGTAKVTFTDDAYGNVYRLSHNGCIIIRSTDGGATWSRIDHEITSLALDLDTLFHSVPIVNDISGDTILAAATSFGLLFSTDQGNNWTVSNKGIVADNITGYQQLSSGRKVICTDLGVFIKDPADTTYLQTFPVGKYIAAGKLWRDDAGNLYVRGAHLKLTASPKSVYKSSDDGSTWQIDTLGLSLVSHNDNFYNEQSFDADANGEQHLAKSFNNSSWGGVYKKVSGGSWQQDTFMIKSLVGTNHYVPHAFTTTNSRVYLAFSTPYVTLSRAVGDSVWSVDTAGASKVHFNYLTHDADGNALATSNLNGAPYSPGIYYRDATKWNKIPLPSNILSSYLTGGLTADATGGILFSSFSDDPQFSILTGHGIYCTHDKGVTWNFVGLDSTMMNQLESFGDTSFALTAAQGIYKLTCNGVILIGVPPVDDHSSNLTLESFPNPFSETTTIHYSLQENSFVKLDVFDIMGSKIAELVNENQNAGEHDVIFNQRGLTNGIYIFKLTTKMGAVTEKIIKE